MKVCPNCHTPARFEEQKFCAVCGHHFGENEAPAPSAPQPAPAAPAPAVSPLEQPVPAGPDGSAGGARGTPPGRAPPPGSCPPHPRQMRRKRMKPPARWSAAARLLPPKLRQMRRKRPSRPARWNAAVRLLHPRHRPKRRQRPHRQRKFRCPPRNLPGFRPNPGPGTAGNGIPPQQPAQPMPSMPPQARGNNRTVPLVVLGVVVFLVVVCILVFVGKQFPAAGVGIPHRDRRTGSLRNPGCRVRRPDAECSRGQYRPLHGSGCHRRAPPRRPRRSRPLWPAIPSWFCATPRPTAPSRWTACR